jgi:uncharacterized protein
VVVRKWVVVVGVAIVAAVAWAAPAGAHVTVQPGEAAKGSFATLAFQVPNERDDAGTTKVEIVFPEDAPIPFVSVEPVPGWQVEKETRELDEPLEAEGGEITEVVSRVTWSGGRVAPGEFQRFFVSAGPLPEDADALEFRALQTYDNGEVVRWIEPTPEGGDEPEHPAPVLTLTEATGDEHGGEASADDASQDAAAPTTEAGAEEEDDDGNGLAIAALVVAVVALLVGGGALVAGRRPRSAS